MRTDLDKIDIAILNMLYENSIQTPLYAWETKTFVEKLNPSVTISYNTVVRRLQKLCEKELLMPGYKNRNSNTYYLLPNGFNFIKNDIIETEESIDIEGEN